MTLRQKLLGWKYQPEIIDLLLAGTSKDDLETLIAEIEGLELGSPELDISRMNLIGGLRSWGVQIPKKRGWYHAIGFEELRTKVPAEEWVGEAREALDWVHSLPKLTPRDAEWVGEGLLDARRENPNGVALHEQSVGYLYCYECGARGVKGYLYSHPQTGNRAVVVQRFVTQPRLKIFQLNLDPLEIVGLARQLAPASVRPVRVLNVSPVLRETPLGFSAHLRPSVTGRREALYHCPTISQSPENFFNRRGLTSLRKARREIEWECLGSPLTDNDRLALTLVIDRWRDFNEKKHRQLAIGRDYAAVHLIDNLGMRAFLGRRNGVPVCIHILSRVEDVPVMAQIVEKSLNYSAMPGGKYGTADFNLWSVCHFYTRFGTEWINGGGYDGGGWGLLDHKAQFARKENDVVSYYIDLLGIPHKETEYYGEKKR